MIKIEPLNTPLNPLHVISPPNNKRTTSSQSYKIKTKSWKNKILNFKNSLRIKLNRLTNLKKIFWKKRKMLWDYINNGNSFRKRLNSFNKIYKMKRSKNKKSAKSTRIWKCTNKNLKSWCKNFNKITTITTCHFSNLLKPGGHLRENKIKKGRMRAACKIYWRKRIFTFRFWKRWGCSLVPLISLR